MKDLPKVFENKINKVINNNKDFYYSNNRMIRKDNVDINKKIDNIFKSCNHVCKSRVIINIDNNIYEEEIIGKNNNYLITMDGKLLRIDKILDIEKI